MNQQPSIRWRGIGYRAHEPDCRPSSICGDTDTPMVDEFGAARLRPLYLALTLEGLLLESRQAFGNRFDPLKIRAYEVDVVDVIDLRTEKDRANAGVGLNSTACTVAFDPASRRFLPSWSLASRLIGQGVVGILTPSYAINARPAMADLVLWRWGPSLPLRVTATNSKVRS